MLPMTHLASCLTLTGLQEDAGTEFLASNGTLTTDFVNMITPLSTGWPLSSQHQIPWLFPDWLFSQEWHRIFKGGAHKYSASASEPENFWVYPYWGTKSSIWGYICYREGNLTVIEKCYSWHTKSKNTSFSLTFPIYPDFSWPLSNSLTFPRSWSYPVSSKKTVLTVQWTTVYSFC